jgi:two-component system aerobic respiration control sensor histidine kinase ArcB
MYKKILSLFKKRIVNCGVCVQSKEISNSTYLKISGEEHPLPNLPHLKELKNNDREEGREKIENKAKSDFIANINHDLRTPMAGILGMLDALLYSIENTDSALDLDQNPTNEKLRYLLNELRNNVNDYGKKAKESAENLMQIFNNILHNLKLDSDELTDSAGFFSLDKMIQSCISLLKPVADIKKLNLTAEIKDETPCYLNGAHQAFRSVLLNLVSNAIKFTPKGSVSIFVEALKYDKFKDKEITIKIEVKDTGIGIPSNKFEEIFGHFSRLTPSFEGTYKGLGLGLYTVKNYMKLMKGTIKVESVEGEGSCFTLLLPFFLDREKINAKDISEKQQHEEAHYAKDVKPAISILLVEDNETVALATRIGLHRMGCHVDLAKTGEEAFDKASSCLYDLIFMDIGLPDVSGIEVTKKIRTLRDSEKSLVPIVVLTGHATGGNRQACLDAGAQYVIEKPAAHNDLRKMLDHFVTKKNALDALDR